MKHSILTPLFKITAAVFISAAISACGGGADTQQLPNTNIQTPDPASYSGPSALTSDVGVFQREVWPHLVNNCAECHNEGGQNPQFARSDDINLAYSAANSIVDLQTPSQSDLVIKVAGGHNCWLASNVVCGNLLEGYIEAWANATVGAPANQISLSTPTIREPGNSRTFPPANTLFVNHVYPLLQQHCSDCHNESGATPRAPYFASDNADSAYASVQSKINLDDAAASRLVVRLRSEFHNCWSGSCSVDATTMETAIDTMAGNIIPTPIDPNLFTSKSLFLGQDGIVASSGGRHEANVIALYEFKAGEGTTAYDTSGITPALNLRMSGDVSWVGGWGIRITNGKAQGDTSESAKLHNLITASGEYSIEAWVAPSNVTQEGPARIVSYSAGNTARNFTLGQTLYNYDFLNRSSTTDANGEPALSTPDADEVLQATQQHVVVTYSVAEGRRIYVNGQLIDEADAQGGGTLNDWDNSFAFVLGNEVSNDQLWQGVIRMVAVHNRALTLEQIEQNFNVGVGQKFFLLFNIGDHLATGGAYSGDMVTAKDPSNADVQVRDAYIAYQVSQFDSYSYLFSEPFFIALNSNTVLNDVPLDGIYIGINGQEADVGQVYANVNVPLNTSAFGELGQPLSRLGTIIPLQNGPMADEFFLSFETINSSTNTHTDTSTVPDVTPADLEPASEIGLRTFEEVNATMSKMTGVSMQNNSVNTTYNIIRQQLPSTDQINTFLASHQVAVAQLAIEYCNELIEDTTSRQNYFPDFTLTGNVTSTWYEADPSLNRRDFYQPLFENMMNVKGALPWDDFDTPAECSTILNPATPRADLNTGLFTEVESHPSTLHTACRIEQLIDTLGNCHNTNSCEPQRDATIAKASCAAVLGSAIMLIQ